MLPHVTAKIFAHLAILKQSIHRRKEGPTVSQYESQFEEKFYNERREKLKLIAALGQKSGLTAAEAIYPNHFRFSPQDIDVPTVHRQYGHATAGQLEADKPHIAIAGRLIAIRLQGKAGFAQLLQGGESLQIYVRKDNVGDDAFDLYKLLDLGDHVGVEGVLFRTRTNELTVQVQKLTFLAKAMLPLPDKYSGLGDIELRYRRRYLDLFTDTGDQPETPTNPGAPSSTGGSIVGQGGVPSADTPTELSSRPESKRSADAAERPASRYPEASASGLIDSPQKTGALAPEEVALTRLPARSVFVKRAAILRAIRSFFDTRGYLEVETPMLHTIAGGAAARPFSTHHNALDIPLSLRIAPELYLKRLVVGGLDRVYEINRNFRNEGVSTQHNPEFTMLEFYQAYANYHDLIDLTEELITYVANEVNGTTLTTFNDTVIDLSQWTKLSMREAIIKFWPAGAAPPPRVEDFSDRKALLGAVTRLYKHIEEIARPLVTAIADNLPELDSDAPVPALLQHRRNAIKWASTTFELGLQLEANVVPLGKLIAELFEFLGESIGPNLIQPTIIYDFPLAVSPLSKVKPNEPDWVERFEFYIGGFEVGNAFSELNDPDDQLRRFEAQLEDRKRGDDEAMAEVDEDYVRALGYGLPPTAGEGIGIDRLTMILTGSRSIRDVILFPLMRPHKPTPSEGDQPISPE